MSGLYNFIKLQFHVTAANESKRLTGAEEKKNICIFGKYFVMLLDDILGIFQHSITRYSKHAHMGKNFTSFYTFFRIKLVNEILIMYHLHFIKF